MYLPPLQYTLGQFCVKYAIPTELLPRFFLLTTFAFLFASLPKTAKTRNVKTGEAGLCPATGSREIKRGKAMYLPPLIRRSLSL